MSVSQVSEWLSCPGGAGLGVLLPHLAPVVVEKTVTGPGLVRAWVRPRADGAACPRCGTWCTGVRGGYSRTLADAAIGGRRVLITVAVRVLACPDEGCPAVTFAEQPPGLTAPYARKTPLLAGQLAAIAAELAGRAGARLARVLAVEVSRHTLVRALMALPEPDGGPVPVLGVDLSGVRGRPSVTSPAWA